MIPSLNDINRAYQQPSVEILDIHGRHIASYGHFHKGALDIKTIPDYTIKALIAIEDRRFYSHYGIDPLGIVRALMRNVDTGRIVQGGSTITQQLAKNILHQKKVFDHRDRSLKRKIIEALLALKIERWFTKDQILEMHLNRAYMGSGTWGLNAASFKYFGRPAKDMNLYESCILIGLLQAPSFYSPAKNQIHSERRGQQVLNAMVNNGFVQQDVADAAMAMPSNLAMENYQISARYFTDWIMDQLHAHGVLHSNNDMVIKTTLDLDLQNIAESVAKKTMEELGPKWKAQQAALVSMDKNGAVHAMVGGLNYIQSPFNRATQAMRQTGSAFKYFVFLSALLEGWSPDSVISDDPITLGSWTARNFKLYKPSGTITLRKAFAQSVNTSTVRLAQNVGIPRIIKMMRLLGVTTPIPKFTKNLTMSLGTLNMNVLEMTSAFAAMINEGMRVVPYGIKQIIHLDGRVLYTHKNIDPTEQIDPEVVQEMRSLLHSVMVAGTGRRANVDTVWCGGKSGTSNTGDGDRDLWFVGITDSVATGVWCGCDDEQPMIHQAGGSPASHIWRRFNQELLNKKKKPI